MTSFGASSFSCVSCSRQYHRECVEELALPKSTLCCKMVKRHLAKDGSELLEPVYESRERPILRDTGSFFILLHFFVFRRGTNIALNRLKLREWTLHG